uniref:Methyltransferase small domain-containing protein n=1 Tax=Ditylenchus dipsaci TaxID=166011 RepID=A0A915ETK9_9BILA
MKKKQLESFLQQLETFDRPRLDLEQYATSPQLGSSILEAINEEIGLNEDTLLADLGCGSGILMIGAARIGAGLSVGFDIDLKALSICQNNIQESGLQESCELLQVDVCACSPTNMRTLSRFEGKFDVVVTNPPFGTKKQFRHRCEVH